MRIVIFFICAFGIVFVISSCTNSRSSESKKSSFFQKKTYNKADSTNGKSAEDNTGCHVCDINTILKLQEKHIATDSVKIYKQQVLTEGTFPIIIYGVPDDDGAFTLVKKWGATHVQRYGMGISVDRDQSFFDRAADHGLKVMSDLRIKYWIKKNNGIDSLRKYVRHFKGHSALGFWYLADEPENKGYLPGELIPFYEILKKETPNIPVAISHAWSKHWYRYGEVQDVLMYDSYPIRGGAFPKTMLNSWTSFTKSAMKQGKRYGDIVIPVLQIFNWKAIVPKEQKFFRGFAVEKLRYPNVRELRYMSFASIALGAHGLSFYSYARSRMVDRNWAGRVLAPVIHEVKRFKNQVKGGKVQQILRGEDADLFLTLWANEESTFMILVNGSSKTRQFRWSLGGTLETGKLKPWGSTRETKAILMNGSLVVEQMKPWDIFIWQVL